MFFFFSNCNFIINLVNRCAGLPDWRVDARRKDPRLSLPAHDFNFDILDNENISLAGTSVATGSGRAMVISTGRETWL